MRSLWPYADDQDVLENIERVLSVMNHITNDIDIYRNALDPFSAMFEIAHQNLTFDEWSEQEKVRQAQKTLQNAVGYFHQKVLGSIDGWRDTGDGGGYDLCNDSLKIIAEIKNKHNTMNSTSAGGTYRKMARYLDTDLVDYTGYIVTIIPKNPIRFTVPYAPPEPGESHPARTDLLRVDGASFYELATGDRDALIKLYLCLPDAIERLSNQNHISDETKIEFKNLFILTFGS